MEEENCRTCLSSLQIEESFNVNMKILENKSTLDLIQNWALIKVSKADKLPASICKICYQKIKWFAGFIVQIRKCDIVLKHSLREDNSNTGIKDEVNALREKLRRVREELQDEQVNYKNNILFEGNNKTLDQISMTNNEYLDSKNVEQPLNEKVKQSSGFYKCPKCAKTFKRSYQYKKHKTEHTGDKKHLCTTCGKYFSQRYVLVYHMRVHTGEKKFKCNVCDKSFIHPSNLYKHRKIHTNTRNYKCEYCDRSFVQSEALKIHIRRIHTGEKPFLCAICSKSFSSQSALWIHKQDTHKEKETCKVCQKQFSSRILKKHIERHNNKEEDVKKCICEQCGKNFSSDHNLKQHLLSHSGLKPYASQPMPCPLCKKLYSKRRIKSHICSALKNK